MLFTVTTEQPALLVMPVPKIKSILSILLESSSGSLVSCVKFNSTNKAYLNFGIGTDLNLLSYEELNYIRMPISEIKEHLLDLLATINLYEKGFYNEDHIL